MSIHTKSDNAAIDADGEMARVGDTVFALSAGRDYPATVVRVIGGFFSSNVEIEYSNGARETAFGADVVRVG